MISFHCIVSLYADVERVFPGLAQTLNCFWFTSPSGTETNFRYPWEQSL